jgi:alpha-glucosidase
LLAQPSGNEIIVKAALPMANIPGSLWWQRAVIYQVYPRSFMDANGDGIGDLAGITSRLDYLAGTLGVDAVWLSPFYPSPMADFGYDVMDYTGVDPVFGNLADFEELLRQIHKRGLKIIIDFVPNHTSDQHPWFIEARRSRNSPKRDWYTWANGHPDGSPPNNWLSVFGGSAWEWDEPSGQYYLHSFLKEQPDLNWRNPQVKAAMLDALRTWLERGVDGFRIDVAHYIMKDPLLRDNPVKSAALRSLHKPLGAYDQQEHLYDKGHPDCHAVYREIRQLLDAYSDPHPRFSVGEIHIFDWEKWAGYYGTSLDELHMPFNFQLLGAKWQAQTIRKSVDSLEAVLPQGAWPNYVLGNHDETRLASRLGPQGARQAAMLLLTLRGTPTLYYGDEIGMLEAEIPPEKQQDPWGLRIPGLGRDGCRTPMQWDDSSNGGCSPQGASTWLPPGANYPEVNVQNQLIQPDSLLNLYRQLLRLRKSHPVLQVGDYQPLDNPPDDCYAYLRRLPGEADILVAINFSARQLSLAYPGLSGGAVILSTSMDRKENLAEDRLHLRPYEGAVIKLPSA